MARMSPIHVGERWQHRSLRNEGEVTGMFVAHTKHDGEICSRWFVQFAVDLHGETTTQRWEETLFLETHKFVAEAPRKVPT